MGSHFSDWAEVTGPIYMGVGTPMPMVWTGIAALLCVVALIAGSMHEHDSYEKLRSRDHNHH